MSTCLRGRDDPEQLTTHTATELIDSGHFALGRAMRDRLAAQPAWTLADGDPRWGSSASRSGSATLPGFLSHGR